MFTIRHLQQILTIAEEGTFNRAAQRLNLSQPALTASIGTLEDRLGYRLFLRSRSGAEPTSFGQHVIRSAPEILSRLHRLEDELSLLSGGQQGVLKVAAGPFVIHGILRQVVPAFCRTYPDIQLTIQTSSPDQIVEDVAAGRLDLGLGALDPAQCGPDVILRLLCEDRMEFVASAQHPLSQRSGLSLDEILTCPISLPEIPRELQRQMSAMEHTYGRKLRPALTTDQYDMILDVVAGGNLVTCAPRRILGPDLRSGRLRVLSHDGTNPTWRVTAAYRPVSELHPVFALLLSMIEEQFKSTQAD